MIKSKKETFEIGNKFKRGTEIYVLTQIGYKNGQKYAGSEKPIEVAIKLINIKTGNRFSDNVLHVESGFNISKKQLDEYTGEEVFKYARRK